MTVSASNSVCAADCYAMRAARVNFYDGTRPTDPDTAVTTQNRLVTLTLGNPAFASPVAGAATAEAIESGVVEIAGTPTWYRVVDPYGAVQRDGDVGSDVVLLNALGDPVTLLAIGETVMVSSWTYRVGAVA